MAQTEVDGQSAERFETTPARSKARTEPRSMEKGNHGDRPRSLIGSAKVSKCQHVPCTGPLHFSHITVMSMTFDLSLTVMSVHQYLYTCWSLPLSNWSVRPQLFSVLVCSVSMSMYHMS